MTKTAKYTMGLIRILIGWIFIWRFMDKMWDLDFNPEAHRSWFGSIRELLLTAQEGPFSEMFHSMAATEWWYLLLLLFVGAGLILGIFTRISGILGAVLMLLLFIHNYPPADNPLVSHHLVYALLFLFFAFSSAGQWMGLNKWWSETRIVSSLPFLK